MQCWRSYSGCPDVTNLGFYSKRDPIMPKARTTGRSRVDEGTGAPQVEDPVVVTGELAAEQRAGRGLLWQPNWRGSRAQGGILPDFPRFFHPQSEVSTLIRCVPGFSWGPETEEQNGSLQTWNQVQTGPWVGAGLVCYKWLYSQGDLIMLNTKR